MNLIRKAHLISIFLGAVAIARAKQVSTITTGSWEVKPTVSSLALSGNSVTDLHLRPMFTTTIRLPEPVTSVAGALQRFSR